LTSVKNLTYLQVYIGYPPPLPRNIGLCHLGVKYEKGERKKGENVKEKKKEER
jgi:hypothetical protein